MPIRFRCKYCNQLLGIARRKGGMGVQCPTCHGKLTVPQKDEPEPNGGPAPQPQLFERSDFEDYLRDPFSEEVVRHAAASRSRASEAAPASASAFDVERVPAEVFTAVATAPGIHLSPRQATILAVVAVLLLAAAFAVGIIVDRLLLTPAAG